MTPHHIPRTASGRIDLDQLNPFPASSTKEAANQAPAAKGKQASSQAAKSADKGSKPAPAAKSKKAEQKPTDPHERLLRALGDVRERIQTIRNNDVAAEHTQRLDAIEEQIDALRMEVVDAQSGGTEKTAKGAMPAPMHLRASAQPADAGRHVPIEDTAIADIGANDRVNKRGDGQLDVQQLTGIYI